MRSVITEYKFMQDLSNPKTFMTKRFGKDQDRGLRVQGSELRAQSLLFVHCIFNKDRPSGLPSAEGSISSE